MWMKLLVYSEAFDPDIKNRMFGSKASVCCMKNLEKNTEK